MEEDEDEEEEEEKASLVNLVVHTRGPHTHITDVSKKSKDRLRDPAL